MRTLKRIKQYIKDWRGRGYEADIPDEVPHALEKLGLAPSYKAIALAILKNDMNMTNLGFSPIKTHWYSAIKRVEIEQRKKSCAE